MAELMLKCVKVEIVMVRMVMFTGVPGEDEWSKGRRVGKVLHEDILPSGCGGDDTKKEEEGGDGNGEEGYGYVEVTFRRLMVEGRAGGEPMVEVDIGDLEVNVGIVKDKDEVMINKRGR